MAYIYQHIREDKNEVFYVGLGTKSGYERAYSKISRNRHWKYISRKTNYRVEILEDNLSKIDACLREIYWIKFYGRRDLGTGTLVNLTDGGEGLLNMSDEIKQIYRDLYSGKTFIERFGEERAKEIGMKIRAANLGQKRPKQSEAMKGRYVGKNNPMYGKTHTTEFKEARRKYLIENNPGKNKTDETRKKISESKKGKSSKLKGKERKKLVCPYCGKEGGEGLIQRWHFDNCKFKDNGIKS